jgi:hypothetical protein
VSPLIVFRITSGLAWTIFAMTPVTSVLPKGRYSSPTSSAPSSRRLSLMISLAVRGNT